MPNFKPYVTTSILTYEHCCNRKYYNTYDFYHAAQATKKKVMCRPIPQKKGIHQALNLNMYVL
jgi:hypothetical protein